MNRAERLAIWALLACAVLCLVVLWRGSSERFEAGGGDDARDSSRETIFVSIGSYRDPDCSATLGNMFARAKHPERVFAGVVQQNSDDPTEACSNAEWKHNVRVLSMRHTEAKGPTYARYLATTLYAGETYFMQIDSHTKFAQDWDELAIADLRLCPSAKPVLSHYPRDFEDYDGHHDDVPRLCDASFDSNGVPTLNAIILPTHGKPQPVPFTSGGFVFAPGSILAEVPYDPNLPMLFQGEEIAYSVRAWTAGWDFFTPVHNIVFHYYVRDDRPKFWADVKDFWSVQESSLEQVRRLLRGELDGYDYGLGARRTLQQYLDYAGIDMEGKTTTAAAKFCS